MLDYLTCFDSFSFVTLMLSYYFFRAQPVTTIHVRGANEQDTIDIRNQTPLPPKEDDTGPTGNQDLHSVKAITNVATWSNEF